MISSPRARPTAPTIGLHLPHFGPLAVTDVLARVVSTAEDRGIGTLWAGDHTAIPVEVASRYPYHASGTASFDSEAPYFDACTLLTFAAARTTRVRVGLSVLVVPYRHPLLVAKALATLDQLSGGRLTVGVGVGWLREEFDVIGVPFERRGAITDAALDVLVAAFADSPVSADGPEFRFPAVGVRPLPAQRPRPPIVVGGHSRPAMRRALRIGDGWQATAGTGEELGRLAAELIDLAGGRLPDGFEISTRVHLPRFDATDRPDRRVIDVLAGYVDAGAHHLLVDLWDREPDRYVARLEALASWLGLDHGVATGLA